MTMKFSTLIPIILFVPSVALANSENKLIQEHLQLVEEGLRLKDVSHLSLEQQQARKQNLDNLRQYWKTGTFPKNTKHPNQRVPYFIDDGGRACAMAHLLIQSGHKEAALQIQLRENNAYVHEIKSPELATWLKTSGLTINEAAWIQPNYAPEKECECPCEVAPVNNEYLSFLNECLAAKCYGISSDNLTAGCIDFEKENRTPQIKTTYPYGIGEMFVCPEAARRGYYEPGMLKTVKELCSQPSQITGKYDPQPTEQGCTKASTSSRHLSSLWMSLLLLLLCVGRKRKQSQ